MNNKLRISLILIIILATMIFSLCNPNPGDNTVANASIFDIPDTITGTSRALVGGKEITPGTKAFVELFFTYAREQILIADDVASQVRDWIVALENLDVFNLTEQYTGETDNGDIVRWTPETDGTYLLEWWKKQDSDGTLKKLMEMDFSEYDNTTGQYIVAGTVIIDMTASNEPDPTDGSKRPEWIKITFDSDTDDGRKYMKIEVDEFQGPELIDPDPIDYQETIIEAWKDENGMVEVVGSTSVPGVTTLSFAEEEELRYYLYEGKGNDQKAVINLGMPLDSYDPATVFDTFENTVGGVIREHEADRMRDTAINDWDNSLIKLLSLLNDPDTSTPYLNVTQGDISQDPPVPTTNDLYNAIEEVYNDGIITDPDALEDVENYLYMMSVTNPAFFDTQSYTGFGDGDFAPDDIDTYPDPNTLPDLTLDNTAVDGLTIAFEGDINPPAVD
jgi:hypothetical protein